MHFSSRTSSNWAHSNLKAATVSLSLRLSLSLKLSLSLRLSAAHWHPTHSLSFFDIHCNKSWHTYIPQSRTRILGHSAGWQHTDCPGSLLACASVSTPAAPLAGPATVPGLLALRAKVRLPGHLAQTPVFTQEPWLRQYQQVCRNPDFAAARVHQKGNGPTYA